MITSQSEEHTPAKACLLIDKQSRRRFEEHAEKILLKEGEDNGP